MSTIFDTNYQRAKAWHDASPRMPKQRERFTRLERAYTWIKSYGKTPDPTRYIDKQTGKNRKQVWEEEFMHQWKLIRPAVTRFENEGN